MAATDFEGAFAALKPPSPEPALLSELKELTDASFRQWDERKRL
jgi:hypothetical protein